MKRLRLSSNGFGLVPLLLIILIAILVSFISYYVYQHEYSNNTTKSNLTKSNVTSNKPKISLTDMTNQLLGSIKTYYIQKGEYPSDITQNMDQLAWDNGYDYVAAGANIKCPAYDNFYSYVGYPDQTTGNITTFGLYYCNGNNAQSVNQSNISFSATDAQSRVEATYNAVLAYAQSIQRVNSSGELSQIKTFLTAPLYNSLAAEFTTSSQDPLLCTDFLPSNFTYANGNQSGQTLNVNITETIPSASDVHINTMVNMSSLQLTSITCL